MCIRDDKVLLSSETLRPGLGSIERLCNSRVTVDWLMYGCRNDFYDLERSPPEPKAAKRNCLPQRAANWLQLLRLTGSAMRDPSGASSQRRSAGLTAQHSAPGLRKIGHLAELRDCMRKDKDHKAREPELKRNSLKPQYDLVA